MVPAQDLLDRARDFAKRAAKQSALRIAPLALVAISARGDIIINPIDDYFTQPVSSSSNNISKPTVTQLSLADGIQGINYSNGAESYASSIGFVSGVGFVADEQYSDASYPGGDPVLLTYDFDFQTQAGTSVQGWSLMFEGGNGDEEVVEGTGEGEFTGTVEALLPSGDADGNFSLNLEADVNFVNYKTASGASLDSLEFDLTTLQISADTAADAVATPEPSSWSLTAPAIGLALLRWRRRRQR